MLNFFRGGLAAALIAASFSVSSAETSASNASIAQLLKVSHADQAINGAREHMHNMIKQMPKQMRLQEQHRDIASPYILKMAALVDAQVTWDKVKPPIVEAYANTFNQQEVDALTAFYQTPVGTKLIEKSPQLMHESMQAAQKIMAAMTPQLQQLQKEMMTAIEQTEAAQNNI